MKSTSSKTASQAIGLDVGTSRVVVALRNGEEFQFESELNAFVSMPFSKLTASVLAKEGVPHSIQNSEIIVHGNESEKFAELMGVETRRPMTRGTLDPKEPESLNLLRHIITTMTGPASKEGQKLCFTVPAPPLGGAESFTYHETTLRQMLNSLGYETRSVNEGLAVIFGELDNSNYTGIGISCGGGLCNVALAYLSVPVMSFSIPKAGDYIDASAAAVTGERANHIRLAKEDSFHLNGLHSDKLFQVIGVYYDDMIDSLVNGMREAFAKVRHLPKIGRPIPLVLSGGTALPTGFRERFEKVLNTAEFPIKISEVRLASSPLHAAAKGALVAALSDM
jgi:hypothetical protein